QFPELWPRKLGFAHACQIRSLRFASLAQNLQFPALSLRKLGLELRPSGFAHACQMFLSILEKDPSIHSIPQSTQAIPDILHGYRNAKILQNGFWRNVSS